MPPTSEPNCTDVQCHVLVVGAGFSGISALHKFRSLGMQVKCFEAGDDLGGVWNNNTYPGARVDSEIPFYQLNIPEVYNTFTFNERFPSGTELKRYFHHIDKVLQLSEDIHFNAAVRRCTWNESTHQWSVKTRQGHHARAKFLLLCTGSLYAAHTPDFQGFHKYQGDVNHSNAWDRSFDASGKRVAIIGAGATGVQITQEVGKTAESLTVFVRRPSYCLPMQQRQLTSSEQSQNASYYPALFAAGQESFTGFPSLRPSQSMFGVSEDERTKLFERLWAAGGSVFALGNFEDIIFDRQASRIAYDFWASKVRSRITDPEKRRVMAPETPPYFFGTKRIPLENDYYEVIDQPNVSVHDLARSPIECFTDHGLITADGEQHTFDAVILATGFDSFTGSIAQMGVQNSHRADLADMWTEDARTYLGLMTAGFPNLFTVFGPGAPTALSNGPSIIEIQVNLIARIVQKMQTEELHHVEAESAAEVEWEESLTVLMDGTLFPYTDSWWNAANVDKKRKGNMLYIGGIDRYNKLCQERIDAWDGFKCF